MLLDIITALLFVPRIQPPQIAITYYGVLNLLESFCRPVTTGISGAVFKRFVHPLVQLIAWPTGISEMKRGPCLVTEKTFNFRDAATC